MSRSRRRRDDGRTIRLIEFTGKYEIVTPDELRELRDEKLVELIKQRGNMDEARAAKTLAKLHRGRPVRAAYDRV